MYVIGITDESRNVWAGLREGTLAIGCVDQGGCPKEWQVITRDAKVINLLQSDIKFTNLQISHATNVTFVFYGKRDVLMTALINTVGDIEKFIDLPLVN